MANFLNKSQIKTLQRIDWEVDPNGFYICLYRDEEEQGVWEYICDHAGVKYDIDKLTLLCIATKINE